MQSGYFHYWGTNMDGLMMFLARIALVAPAFLVAVAVHEYAHGLVAYWLGDDTAEKMGRLTLNPFRHLDLLGTAMLFLVGVGWAKPVMFDDRNFKYPRIFSLLVAYAGPLANFLTAALFICLIKLLSFISLDPLLMISIHQVLDAVVTINIMLGIFNLIPIPPLDGSHLIRVMMPSKWLPYYYSIAQLSIFLWIVLLMTSSTRMIFEHSVMGVRAWLEHILLG